MRQEKVYGALKACCKISQEAEDTVFDIIRKDLKPTCFKKQKAHDLTEANGERLLKRYPNLVQRCTLYSI